MIRSTWVLLALLLGILFGCEDPGDPHPFVLVSLAGRAVDHSTSAGVSGMKIVLLELDSLRRLGTNPVVLGQDTTSQLGHFSVELRLDSPGNVCAGSINFIVTLRFTDPFARYATKDVRETICRRTPAEIEAGMSLRVLLDRTTQ